MSAGLKLSDDREEPLLPYSNQTLRHDSSHRLGRRTIISCEIGFSYLPHLNATCKGCIGERINSVTPKSSSKFSSTINRK